MFYILYQVTNDLNGKIYVGVHKTKKLDDGYMGSGRVINAAIKKYGVENFTRVILEQFETSAAMYAREKEVVTEEFLAREDTYNLRRGGDGGFDYINKEKLNFVYGYVPSIEEREKASNTMRKKYASGELVSSFVTNNPMKTEAGKVAQKLAFTAIGHSKGEKNSQFGSKWITNEVSNKKIKKDDPVPEGWRAGRKVSVPQ